MRTKRVWPIIIVSRVLGVGQCLTDICWVSELINEKDNLWEEMVWEQWYRGEEEQEYLAREKDQSDCYGRFTFGQ